MVNHQLTFITNAAMERKLCSLRKAMRDSKLVPEHLAAYIIPTEDAHQVS